MNKLLEVKNLSLGFEIDQKIQKAVDGVSISVEQGEVLALVGESGCGKTMLAQALLRLFPERTQICSGQILWRGKDLFTLTEKEIRQVRGKEIAMVFQEPLTALNPILRVGEQILEIVRAHLEISKLEAKQKTIQMLEKVGLDEPQKRFEQYPHELSGGMRQRVMIAMALVLKPQLLIADEPTTALDATIQAEIVDLVLGLRREFQMTVIWISHDLPLVIKIAERIGVMYAGVIVELGTKEDISKNPRHPYTQALLRSIPEGVRKNRQDRLLNIPGQVPPLGKVPSYCRFYDRCDVHEEKCKTGEPELVKLKEDHWVRCIHV